MSVTLKPAQPRADVERAGGRKRSRVSAVDRSYPLWFYIPAAVVFIALFAVPTFASFWFSLTRWTLFDVTFIGFENFELFFREPMLITGLRNTLIYAVLTSGLKIVLGFLLGLLLTSQIIARGYLRAVTFFPVLISTVGVGITFTALLDPFGGVVNEALGFFGIQGPGWFTDPQMALVTIALVDVWKGIGIAALIYTAAIVSIPQEYLEAARVDGASTFQRTKNIIVPLSWPATSTVALLSLIGGLRSFELIWATTGGGPGFASDVIASVIYKQYQAGFFGLSTAGNVVLFVLVFAIVFPLSWWLRRREVDR